MDELEEILELLYNKGETIRCRDAPLVPNLINIEAVDSVLKLYPLSDLVPPMPPNGNLLFISFNSYFQLVWLHIYSRDVSLSPHLYRWIDASTFRVVES